MITQMTDEEIHALAAERYKLRPPWQEVLNEPYPAKTKLLQIGVKSTDTFKEAKSKVIEYASLHGHFDRRVDYTYVTKCILEDAHRESNERIQKIANDIVQERRNLFKPIVSPSKSSLFKQVEGDSKK